MLLAMDIGNTNIGLGVYKNDRLAARWRIGTKKGRTSDEYGILIKEILSASDIGANRINSIIISSVVPPLDSVIIEMSQRYFNTQPLMVGPGVKNGLPILYENPKEVGADRIVNAVAALKKFAAPLIIVDFGTATTFDLLTSKGEYGGGVIAPGIGISTEALFRTASKLPRVDFVKPKRVIGKSTVDSIQSGLIFGYVGLVDGIVARMKKEVAKTAKVIATGGYAHIIATESSEIEHVVEDLTLEGLKIIYDINQNNP